jgi:hypothetical protein
VAKDRAAPFSKKHRRYWIPVTGGMILIGLVNVVIGLCSYKDPPATQPMELNLGSAHDLGSVPTPVMRAFTARYPRMLPSAVDRRPDGAWVLALPSGKHATFRDDGTFVSEE